MKLGVFLVGTDAGVGKTVISSLIASALRTFSIRTGYYKPIQTGSRSDLQTVAELAAIPVARMPPPTYQFPDPVVPYRAAMMRGMEVQLDRILQDWNSLDDRAWIVEGVGGLLTPLNSKRTNRDLIQLLGLKTLVVSSTQPGNLSHTLLTIESAQTTGLNVAGIVLSGDDDSGIDSMLTDFSGIPVIARIPQFSCISPSLIQDAGVTYFPASVLSLLFE